MNREEYIGILETENAELKQENQRLNSDIKVLLNENEAKEKVIIRQDNILNELEKYINNTESFYSIGDIQKKYRMVEVNDVLDKLKELKESDK